MTLAFFTTLLPVFAQASAEPGTGIPGAVGLGIGMMLFGLFSMAIPVLAIVLQVVCIVHVIRGRRDYWWIFLILFFPYVGALVYFFVEMYPELRRRRFGATPYKGGSARRRIRQLEDFITYSDTVENRSELGTAYCEVGEFDKAKACFEECLQGIYKDDPHLLFGLAKACFGLGAAPEALKAVERTFKADTRDYLNERHLLKARCLEKLERTEDALQEYAAVASKLSGLEGRYRYGSLLRRSGNAPEAKRVFNSLLADAKRMSSVARRREKTWVQHTRRELQEMG